MLVACDESLFPSMCSLIDAVSKSAEHVDTFEAAVDLASRKHFDIVMVEIFFDGGLRLFDLIRMIRASDSRNARIICFRGTPALVSGVCDDAVAHAAKVIAGAEYWDLSSEPKRTHARSELFISMSGR
jgi:hypothetical protein